MGSKKKAKKYAKKNTKAQPVDVPSFGLLVSWDIDVFGDIVGLSDDMPIEDRVLVCAKYACDRYFKDMGWVFRVTIPVAGPARQFLVDTQTNKVEEVKYAKDCRIT